MFRSCFGHYELWITPRRRTLGDEPAESCTIGGEKPFEHVENGRESERTKQSAEWPGESNLGKECNASAPIACDKCAIPKHDPPTRAAPLFGNCREQTVGFRVCQRKQRQLLAAVDYGDDPRRPAADLSAAVVEHHGSPESPRAGGACGIRPLAWCRDLHLQIFLRQSGFVGGPSERVSTD